MRAIGHVDTQTQAERFAAWLLTHDITTHCEEHDGSWQVWVRDEDKVEKASTELREFQSQPDAPRYRAAVEEANRLVRQKAKKLQQLRSQQVQISRDRWHAPLHRTAPLTVALIIISVIVALLTNFGASLEGATFRALAFASIDQDEAIRIAGADGLNPWNNRLRLASLAKGEVWRTVTPVFLHFGVVHLLFNMIMLGAFGRQIEYRYGSVWMLFLVLAFAVPSTVAGCIAPAQFDGVGIFDTGSYWTVPTGGMSGVVYGLFGYVLIKMIFDARSGLFVSMSGVVILLVWLVLGMTPSFHEWFGFRVNNWAHGVGLLAGMIAGYWPKLLSDLGIGRRRSRKESGDPDEKR